MVISFPTGICYPASAHRKVMNTLKRVLRNSRLIIFDVMQMFEFEHNTAFIACCRPLDLGRTTRQSS